MLGDNLRKALSDARIPHQEAADKMGISKGNLYNLFKRDSFDVGYLIRASEMTGRPINDLLDYKSEILDSNTKEETKSSASTIGRLSRSIDELKAMFEEEIRAKNQQIAGLQRTVDVLVGKFEGAIVDRPLSEMGFEGLYQCYRASVLGHGDSIPFIFDPLSAKLVAPRSL